MNRHDVRAKRKLWGLSQKELARQMGYSNSSVVANVERGVCRLSERFEERFRSIEAKLEPDALRSLRGVIDLDRDLFRTSSGVLYVVKAEGLKRYKIGIAGDPARRLRDLQMASPLKLEVIAVRQLLSPRITEFRLHRVLEKHRAWGEWYDLSDALLVELLENLGLSPNGGNDERFAP